MFVNKVSNLNIISTEEAVVYLKDGQLVILPTDTVYGIAANALNPDAVQLIFDVKQRPLEKSLIWQVSTVEMAKKYVVWSQNAQLLVEKYWPGPLTIVLPRINGLPGETLGVRICGCLETREIIEKCGFPLAMPSANISGQKSAKNYDELNSYFADEKRIEGAVIVEKLEYGKESTIVDLVDDIPKILREGVLSETEILSLFK